MAINTAAPNLGNVNPVTESHAGSHDGTYLLVFIALAALTLVEVVVSYVPLVQILKIPLLLGLAAVKAFLVAAFYMHLRYEKRILAVVFTIPVVIGVLIGLAIQQLVLR